MPTLNARFSSPSTLRSIRPDLLMAWLRPSAGYLEDRGFKLPECGVANGKGHLTLALSPRGGEGEHSELRSAAGNGEGEATAARRVDYDRLAEIFMNPTAGMPAEGNATVE
jgi:hypothetical protein